MKVKIGKFYNFDVKFFIMRDSNFWFYTIMVIVIAHFVIGFGYLIYKLSPKKEDKDKKNEQK